MDEFSGLVAVLKRLRPAQPSEALLVRVEARLRNRPHATAGVIPSAARSSKAWLLWWLGAAAAICIGTAAIFMDRALQQSPTVTSAPAPSRGVFIPAARTQVVYRSWSEGLHFADESHPLRRTRSQTCETVQWQNRQTGASLRLSFPAEEVVLTPVSFQ
jgi:hypothetical protein